MNKHITRLLTLALFAPAFVSCMEQIEETRPQDQKHTVYFSAVEDATKTGLSIDGTTVNPNWIGTVKDDVHLYEINGETRTLGTTNAIQLEGTDNLTARFEAEFSTASGSYTYGAVVAKTNAAGAFYIPATQQPQAATLKDPGADFLVGYSRFEYSSPTGDDDLLVDLFFDRVAALSRIGFTEFKRSDEKVLSVTIKSETSMTGSATLDKVAFADPSTVTFTPDDGAGVLTLTYGEGVSVPSDGTFYAYFVSMPGKFKITGIEIQTDKYLYKKALSAEVTFSLTELKNLKVKLSTSTIPVESVSLNKTELALNVGATETLTATVLPDLASNKKVTWTSSDETVASVDANGKVTALAQGEADITVTTEDGGKTASCTVTVSDVYNYSLAITAAKDAINVNEELQYTAKLTTVKNNGTPEETDLSEGVTWSSLSEAIASISAQGVATGLAGGKTTIKASYKPEHADVPIEATAELTVNDVISYSFEVTATEEEIKYNETSTFTAILTTTTNGIAVEKDVTDEATWTSSDETVATLAGNIATGIKGGTTTIKATYNGYSDEVTLTVKDVVSHRLVIDPATATINFDETQAFKAMLYTTTNDVEDNGNEVTASTWTSIATGVATITSEGVATGVKGGETTITAKYTPAGAGSTEISATATLNVKDVVSYRLAIDPADATINYNETQAFKAMLYTKTNGVEDNGNEVNASSWTSSATGVATITSEGIATGVKGGETSITAKYTPAGYSELSATATLTVNDVITYAVTISPTTEDLPRVIIGNELTFTLTLITTTNGAPDDGTDVTADATWETSNAGVATVAKGVVTGVSEGTATVTATFNDPKNEPHSFEVLIAVTKDPNHAGDPIEVGTETEM